MNHRSLRSSALWLAPFAGALLLLALVPAASGSTHSASLTPASFEDDFTTNGTDAGYVVALRRGYYKQQGIDMTYSPGTGSTTTAQAVASGQVTFGEIATSQLVTSVSQGEPIKAIAVVNGSDGFGVVAKSDITTPQQLEGKTVVTASPLLTPLFQAYAKQKGISGVHLIQVAPSALDTSMTSGTADGCLCVSYSDRLRINAVLGKTSFFPFSDVGLGFTGNVIIANTKTIQDNPALVRGFLAAAIKGWNFAFDNPNLAAGDLQAEVSSQSPLASAQTNVATLKIMKKLRYTKNTIGHPPGWISVVDIANAVKQLKIEGVLQGAAPAASSLFTNQFIPTPKTAPKKKK